MRIDDVRLPWLPRREVETDRVARGHSIERGPLGVDQPVAMGPRV
jgi:hypothetical protein